MQPTTPSNKNQQAVIVGSSSRQTSARITDVRNYNLDNAQRYANKLLLLNSNPNKTFLLELIS